MLYGENIIPSFHGEGMKKNEIILKFTTPSMAAEHLGRKDVALPQQASSVASPAGKSAFMFISSTHVKSLWAIFSGPGAKSVLSLPEQTCAAREYYTHYNTHIFTCL